MAELCAARLTVAAGGIARWRARLGWAGIAGPAEQIAARRLAAHVERGAGRLPFASKCLPQAIALSRMLRRRRIAHRLVIAARPADRRGGSDDLHAWVECGDAIVIGDLAGPWLRVVEIP